MPTKKKGYHVMSFIPTDEQKHIMDVTRQLMAEYRSLYPMPQNASCHSTDAELNSYLDKQMEYVNRRLKELSIIK